jgi:mannose-1-phosphate guanylyltransferase
VSDDELFMAHVKAAFDVVRARGDLVVLLGIGPDTAEVEYGWIEPGDRITGPWAPEVYRVRRFWEKPSPVLAQTLRARGCLWNSFVIVTYPSALIALIKSAVPELFDAFASVHSRLGTPWEDDAVRRLYARLASTDFSTCVLATRPANLAVLPVGGVEWSDLGDPHRVNLTLARIHTCCTSADEGKRRSA